MAGISSKGLNVGGNDNNCGCPNKKGYNGNEIQNKEFIDGSGLEVYDFNARTYDQQIGRFTQIDPLSEEGGQESLSPYQFGYNDPIRYEDADGRCPACLVYGLFELGKAVVAAYAAYKVTEYVVTNDPPDISLSLPNRGAAPTGEGVVVGNSYTMGTTSGSYTPSSTNSTGKGADAFGAVTQSLGRTLAEGKKFDGHNSTENKTAKEALRNAKDQNGIPRSQQPDKTIKPNTPEGDKAGLDKRNVKQYQYTNSKGEKKVIRQDKPAQYSDGGTQPPHFNAGQGTKLDQHHNYQQKKYIRFRW